MPRNTATDRFTIRNYTSAIDFNGSTSYLSKTSPTGLSVGSGSITIAGWVYLRSTVLGTFTELHVNSAQSLSFGLGQSGAVYFVFSDRVNANNNMSISSSQFLTSIGLNNWRFVTWVVTPTVVRFYSGASLLSTFTLGTAISAGAINTLLIGKGLTAGQADIQFLDGIIKDVRYYNVGLTQSQISSLMFTGLDPVTPISSILMNDGSGTSVADIVGSNTMTATNITWTTSYKPFGPRATPSGKVLASGRVPIS